MSQFPHANYLNFENVRTNPYFIYYIIIMYTYCCLSTLSTVLRHFWKKSLLLFCWYHFISKLDFHTGSWYYYKFIFTVLIRSTISHYFYCNLQIHWSTYTILILDLTWSRHTSLNQLLINRLSLSSLSLSSSPSAGYHLH